MLINFKPLKSTFLHAESTTRSLQIMILNVGYCNPFILSSVSSKCVRDHIISRYNSFQETVVCGVVFRFNRKPSSKKTPFCIVAYATQPCQGRIQDFFRRGCTRLLLYFNTNKPHSFFLAEYQLYQKTAGHLGGKVHTPCTLPLDPPLLAGLKTQKPRTRSSFVKIGVLRLTTHQTDGIETDQ